MQSACATFEHKVHVEALSLIVQTLTCGHRFSTVKAIVEYDGFESLVVTMGFRVLGLAG
jgi:hypothetical protein